MEQSKVSDQIRTEVESFKRQQETVNEKITDMIKLETDARERAEDDKKQML